MNFQDKAKEILEKFDKISTTPTQTEFGEVLDLDKIYAEMRILISHSLSEIAEATKEAIVPDRFSYRNWTVPEEEGFNSAIDEINNRYREFIGKEKV